MLDKIGTQKRVRDVCGTFVEHQKVFPQKARKNELFEGKLLDKCAKSLAPESVAAQGSDQSVARSMSFHASRQFRYLSGLLIIKIDVVL